MSCIFCDRSFAGDVLFENDDALVVLHEDWSVRGHVMVVARRHVENAAGLTSEEWMRLARIYHDVERAVLDVTGADRAIMLKLGIQAPHLHLHIYPVSNQLTRADVMNVIDSKVGVPRDPALIEELRKAL
jgi:histidine triad (HIT) family protein